MKNKKIFIIIGLVFLVLFIVYLVLNRKEVIVDKEKHPLELSNDYNDYLTINNVVNDYLLDLSLNNKDNVSTKNNYYSEKVYYINLESNTYYYVSGLSMIYDYNTNEMIEKQDDCYLINVYKPNNAYTLKKIDNIESYYKENDIEDGINIEQQNNNFGSGTQINVKK